MLAGRGVQAPRWGDHQVWALRSAGTSRRSFDWDIAVRLSISPSVRRTPVQAHLDKPRTGQFKPPYVRRLLMPNFLKNPSTAYGN